MQADHVVLFIVTSDYQRSDCVAVYENLVMCALHTTSKLTTIKHVEWFQSASALQVFTTDNRQVA